jgi:hypothetical protein
VVKIFFKITKKCIFHFNFLVFLPLDPDPDSQYGSGSTKSLNPDPILIHNPARQASHGLRKYFCLVTEMTAKLEANNEIDVDEAVTATAPLYK